MFAVFERRLHGTAVYHRMAKKEQCGEEEHADGDDNEFDIFKERPRDQTATVGRHLFRWLRRCFFGEEGITV